MLGLHQIYHEILKTYITGNIWKSQRRIGISNECLNGEGKHYFVPILQMSSYFPSDLIKLRHLKTSCVYCVCRSGFLSCFPFRTCYGTHWTTNSVLHRSRGKFLIVETFVRVDSSFFRALIHSRPQTLLFL